MVRCARREFALQGVIVVTVNYRVHENIKAFGGDPKNVTIFGESAGAISVNYLMPAPQAKGLFERALSEPGFGRLRPGPNSTPPMNT
jgi:carboxylesterase type B